MHFLTFLVGYIHPNNLKTKNKPLGLCPKPPLTCEAAGAGGKPIHLPYGSVGSIPGVRVQMRDFDKPADLSISVGVTVFRSGRS